jgi:hypothetical protein
LERAFINLMCKTDPFFLEVETIELTRALRILCKDKSSAICRLKYRNKQVTISIGRRDEDVPAQGSWPGDVSTSREWAETLATTPYEVAITTLQVLDGKLWARDFCRPCEVTPGQVEDEDAVTRRKNIASAAKFLARHHMTEKDIETLIDQADTSKAALWSPDDERLVGDIFGAWRSLFSYGVEPSDIRRALHTKSRKLWTNPPAGAK